MHKRVLYHVLRVLLQFVNRMITGIGISVGRVLVQTFATAHFYSKVEQRALFEASTSERNPHFIFQHDNFALSYSQPLDCRY